MADSIPILAGKLNVPQISETIDRERLTVRLAEIEKKRLALVVAGAGFGKTTAVAKAISEMDQPIVWYRLDPKDSDPFLFLQYLVIGIAGHFPSLDSVLSDLSRFSNRSGSALHRFSLSLASKLEAVINEPLYIVLDDFHFIQDQPGITDFVSFFLEHFPVQVHFILITRQEPGPHLNIGRLQSLRNICYISETDLKFTFEEVGSFFREILDQNLSDEELRSIHRTTDGWIAGLILLYQFQDSPSQAIARKNIPRTQRVEKRLATFFDEAVFLNLAPEIQEFMLKTSILNPLDARFCDDLLGIENSAVILSQLEDKHIFTTCLDRESGTYAYHDLLKDFLVSKFAVEYLKKDRQQIHRKAGELYQCQNQAEEAIYHFLEGDSVERARQIFLKSGYQGLFLFSIHSFELFFDKIDSSGVEKDTTLLLIQSRLKTLRGDSQGAIDCLQTGETIEKNAVTPNTELLTWICKELGMQYYYSGKIPQAISQYRSVLENRSIDPLLATEVSGMLGFLLSVQGKLNEAEAFINKSLEYVDQMPPIVKLFLTSWIRMNQSNLLYCKGQFTQAELIALEGKRIIDRHNLVMFSTLACFQIAYVQLATNKFADALKNARKGIQVSIDNGMNDSFLAWLYYAEGSSLLGLGMVEEAELSGNNSLDLFSRIGNKWGAANSRELLHKIAITRKDLNGALVQLDLGLEEIRNQSTPGTEVVLNLAKASLLTRLERPYEALELISLIPLADTYEYYFCVCQLLISGLYLKTDKGSQAESHFLKGITLAEKNDYDIEAICELLPVQPELSKLKTSSLKTTGIDFTRPTRSEKKLDVELFGAFKVYRDGDEIDASNWKHVAVEELFKYLASHSEKGFIPSEILIEVLWPETQSSKGKKRLNVALTTLRNILEPERTPRSESVFIRRDKNGYRLDVGKDGTIDIVRFKQDLQKAESKTGNAPEIIELLSQTEALYKGPYLASDLYLDWCTEIRDDLSRRYLTILRRLIEHYASSNQVDPCLSYINKYLAIDPYNENIHTEKMKAYSYAGNRKMVIQSFQELTSMLDEDLGLSVSAETTAIYQSLLN